MTPPVAMASSSGWAWKATNVLFGSVLMPVTS
jgi:hypothetical protein